MSRFTNETLENAIKTYKTLVEACDGVGDDDYCPILDKVTVELLEELKEYRKLEEQGLLLKLPLAKEDAFWEINRRTTPPSCYKRYAHSYQHCVYVLERLGKTCFLTKAEAEKALAEMEK